MVSARMAAALQRYYGQLAGALVEMVSLTRDADGLWPTLVLRLADGTRVQVVVAADAEQNQPGHLAGLPERPVAGEWSRDR